jgi:ubiquinone/menaquinone biosynthesis C-methylase UbiE
MTVSEQATPDLQQVKQKQQLMWASGDFHQVAAVIQSVADSVAEELDIQAGWRVLDVATGSGNGALAAARLGAEAVGVDYVPALLERGRRRVEAEGLDVVLVEGDAEALPFADGEFDAVTSVFGSMFAPDHEQAAAELARVVKPGGKIGLATWTSDGFIGELLRAIAQHVLPAAGVASPILWGTETYLRRIFGDAISSMRCQEQTFVFRFRSSEAWVDFFRAYYGPTFKAFEAVGPEGEQALHADLVALVDTYAGRGEGPIAIPATWLQTVAVRR